MLSADHQLLPLNALLLRCRYCQDAVAQVLGTPNQVEMYPPAPICFLRRFKEAHSAHSMASAHSGEDDAGAAHAAAAAWDAVWCHPAGVFVS